MPNPKYCYDYPRPALSADCLIIDINLMQILLIERKFEPFKGSWAFPGGFVEENERVEEGAKRELEEETGIHGVTPELVGVYSDPDRDPRGRMITVAYLFRVRKNELLPVAGDDAMNVRWFSLGKLPKLAFDHQKIIDDCLQIF